MVATGCNLLQVLAAGPPEVRQPVVQFLAVDVAGLPRSAWLERLQDQPGHGGAELAPVATPKCYAARATDHVRLEPAELVLDLGIPAGSPARPDGTVCPSEVARVPWDLLEVQLLLSSDGRPASARTPALRTLGRTPETRRSRWPPPSCRAGTPWRDDRQRSWSGADRARQSPQTRETAPLERTRGTDRQSPPCAPPRRHRMAAGSAGRTSPMGLGMSSNRRQGPRGSVQRPRSSGLCVLRPNNDRGANGEHRAYARSVYSSGPWGAHRQMYRSADESGAASP